MSEATINIIDDTLHVAVLSGKYDEPDDWIQKDNTFINTNIPKIKLNLLKENNNITYEYIIESIDGLSLCIRSLDDSISTNIVTIQSFLDNINDYDDITVTNNEYKSFNAELNIDNTDIIFIVKKQIGYKKCKYTLKIILKQESIVNNPNN